MLPMDRKDNVEKMIQWETTGENRGESFKIMKCR